MSLTPDARRVGALQIGVAALQAGVLAAWWLAAPAPPPRWAALTLALFALTLLLQGLAHRTRGRRRTALRYASLPAALAALGAAVAGIT